MLKHPILPQDDYQRNGTACWIKNGAEIRKEGKKQGRKEGRKEGTKEGRKEGKERGREIK